MMRNTYDVKIRHFKFTYLILFEAQHNHIHSNYVFFSFLILASYTTFRSQDLQLTSYIDENKEKHLFYLFTK